MPYAVLHHFRGGTKEQYQASFALAHAGQNVPEGQMFQAAGPSTQGWMIVAVYNSKESWERFRDSVLTPKLKEGVPGGFATSPQETAFEVNL